MLRGVLRVGNSLVCVEASSGGQSVLSQAFAPGVNITDTIALALGGVRHGSRHKTGGEDKKRQEFRSVVKVMICQKYVPLFHLSCSILSQVPSRLPCGTPPAFASIQEVRRSDWWMEELQKLRALSWTWKVGIYQAFPVGRKMIILYFFLLLSIDGKLMINLKIHAYFVQLGLDFIYNSLMLLAGFLLVRSCFNISSVCEGLDFSAECRLLFFSGIQLIGNESQDV